MIEAGGVHTYELKVRLSFEVGKSVADVEECKAGGNAPNTSFTNTVSITHNGKPKTSTACDNPPVQEKMIVQKFGTNCDAQAPECALVGADFSIYSSDPDLPNAVLVGEMDLLGTNTFQSPALNVGVEYWLVETKAPLGHSPLPGPIKFKLSGTYPDGEIVLIDSKVPVADQLVAVDANDKLTLKVFDPTKGNLPKAGGEGHFVPAILGFLFLLGAGIFIVLSDPRRGHARR